MPKFGPQQKNDVEITEDELLCLQVLVNNYSLSARTVGNNLPSGIRSYQWASWRLRMLAKKGFVTENLRHQYTFCAPHYEYRITTAGHAKLEEATKQSTEPLALGISDREWGSNSPLIQPSQ